MYRNSGLSSASCVRLGLRATSDAFGHGTAADPTPHGPAPNHVCFRGAVCGIAFASSPGMHGRIALLAGCLLLTGCAAEIDDEDEARATEMGVTSTRDIKIVHWNISGAVINRGFNNVVDKLFDEIKAQQPDVVSINEGCRDQVEHLRDRLRSSGFGSATLQFAPTGDNAACVRSFGTNTAQAGPAVIILAGGRNGQNHYWRDTESVDSRTDRGMACLTAQVGRDVRVCSLHLATNDATAAAQAESMVRRWEVPFRDNPHLLIGDYNASPDYLKQHAPKLYGDFYEADAARNQATHGEGKLDFVFMSKPTFVPEASVTIKDMGTYDPWWGGRRTYSDHRLVHATVKVRL